MIAIIILQSFLIACLLVVVIYQRNRLRRMAGQSDNKSPIEYYAKPSKRQRASYSNPIGKEIK